MGGIVEVEKMCLIFENKIILKSNKIQGLRDFLNIDFLVSIFPFATSLKSFVFNGFNGTETKTKSQNGKNGGLKMKGRAGQQPPSLFRSRTVPFETKPARRRRFSVAANRDKDLQKTSVIDGKMSGWQNIIF